MINKKKERDLKGNIRSNSIIMCEMMITSDSEFFERIGEKETRRYFEESYKFVCNYKNLGEENIISSVVHLDEEVSHMHLIYVPVIHTKDKENNEIDKICCRDFWEGRDSYRTLQNDYYNYITSKGFELERGLPVEETGAKHQKIEDLKKLTNYENTKKVLKNMKLELPETPDINDIKLIKLNKERVMNEIIKPKDDLITELYNDKLTLQQVLTRQAKVIEVAEKYQKERDKILADNEELHNEVKHLEHEYKMKNNTLDLRFNNRKRELEEEYEDKSYNLERQYKNEINKLENQNSKLNRIIDTFYDNMHKFINWICKKFAVSEDYNLIRDFEKENHILLDPQEQIKKEDREKEWELER